MSSFKFIDIMNAYDNSNPVSAGLSNSHLESISKTVAENRSAAQNKNQVLPANKAEGLVNIAKRAEQAINVKLPKEFRINLTTTFNAQNANSVAGGKNGIYLQSMGGNNVAMNLNLKRISRLPALEAFAVIYESLSNFAFKGQNISVDEFKEEVKEDSKLDKNDGKSKNSKADAIKVLSAYIERFLKNYANKYKTYSGISDEIAKLIVEDMNEQDYEKILSPFFKLEDINEKAYKVIDRFKVTKINNPRLNCILEKTESESLLLKGESDVKRLNYLQQYQELMSISTKDEFAKAMNNGSNSLNKFTDFCLSYVNNFLNSNGLKNIAVTFNSKGELGTFYDTNPPRININLSKIDSISELVMTLSHELTHAVDSCTNKVKGNFNRDGGGLLNDIGENISNSGLNEGSDEYNFLSELNYYCYHVNPNERNARVGELSALMFLDDNLNSSADLKSQLKVSLETYIAYQNKTSTILNELTDEKIKSLRETFSNFSGLPKKASDLMLERINYLEEIKNKNFMPMAEADSIMVAQKLLDKQLTQAEAEKQISISSKEM